MIFLDLFLTFLKIGSFTFGGGYAMIALIQEEVIHHGWLTQETLIDFIAISESSPGPIAVNMATFVGNQIAGITGAIIATLGIVLPSFIIILMIAKIYTQFKNNQHVKRFMSGIKPAAVGLIASAVLSLATTVFKPYKLSIDLGIAILIFGLCLYLSFHKKSPILVICLSAILGILFL